MDFRRTENRAESKPPSSAKKEQTAGAKWLMHYLAGFDVKDVHMTDLATGRETLEDINMIVFCGGFSNSDVLGSAKGWAGDFAQR